MKKLIIALFVISLTGVSAFAQNVATPATDVKTTASGSTSSALTTEQPKSTKTKAIKAKKNKKTISATKKAKNEDNKEIIK